MFLLQRGHPQIGAKNSNHSKDQLDLLGQAATEIARINVQIAELTEYKNQLLEVFKNPDTDLPPRSEPYDFGDVEVKVSTNVRLDDGLARRNLTPANYEIVSKTTLDTGKARKVLTADELATITKTFDNKIEVRLK